ncbi:DNA polymerase [Vibrio phage D260]
MAKIAVITPKATKMDMSRSFGFPVDQYALTSQNVKRVLVRDVDIEIDVHDYDWVILVGAEPLKYFSKETSVTDQTGSRVTAKPKKDWSDYEGFLASINPAAMHFKPEIKPVFEFTVERLTSHIDGTYQPPSACAYNIIADSTTALNMYLKGVLTAIKNGETDCVALDTETGALYARKGELLGFSCTYLDREGMYCSADIIDDETCWLLQQICDSDAEIVLHNMKFDIHWFKHHMNLSFDKAFAENRAHDSMIQHYVLDERRGHGLKPLAIKHTDMGNYDAELDEWKKAYCKSHKIKQADFTYDLFPFEMLSEYAVRDTDATRRLHKKFIPLIRRNARLLELYEKLLMPATRFLARMEDRGVPVSVPRLKVAQKILHDKIFEAEQELYQIPSVIAFEEGEGVKFNPQSPIQMRKLLFDYDDYTPTGKLTDTGEISCDAEVLTKLSEFGDLPKALLKIRRNSKLLSSFITKMLDHVDDDGCVRTGFNLATVTSGRLSSSGTINLQQLPSRTAIIKGCITARPGYKIVAWDMVTAEVYIAAVLSGDEGLQQIFIDSANDPANSADLHSQMAHMIFRLPGKATEVKKNHAMWRQASKCITFAILYGSGVASMTDSINEAMLEDHIETGSPYNPVTQEDVKGYVETYFNRFPRLKKWIDESHEQIRQHGFIYGHFGRKRRLHNVRSDDRGLVAGEVRSGFNAIIQGASSDLLLAGVIDLDNYIEESGLDASIIALVHDSIVAEVKIEQVAEYEQLLINFVQADRINGLGENLQMPGCPMGVENDSEDGGSVDYSCGKLQKEFPEIAIMDDPVFLAKCMKMFQDNEFPKGYERVAEIGTYLQDEYA